MEMSLNDVIVQLGSLRDNSADSLRADPENDLWSTDVAACDTAIKVLAALAGVGCTNLDDVLDVLDDYRGLAGQYKALYQKYETRSKPVRKETDEVWHCPVCSRRVHINQSHCHHCGKKLWWDRGITSLVRAGKRQ